MSTTAAAPATPAASQAPIATLAPRLALGAAALIALGVGRAHYVIPVDQPSCQPFEAIRATPPDGGPSASATHTLTVTGTNLAGQPDTGRSRGFRDGVRSSSPYLVALARAARMVASSAGVPAGSLKGP
jgi:hypothetical protein